LSGPHAGLLALALASPQAQPSKAPPDTAAPLVVGLPEVLPFEPQVKDPVFAVLLALVRSGLYGVLTREHLERELARRSVRSRLPYRVVREVQRSPGALGETARVSLRFERTLDVPIPYSILWYHPGRIRGEPACEFREWPLGTVQVSHQPRPDGPPAAFELADVHLFALEAGALSVDIDGWLDRLMGSALDDTDVNGVVIFRYQGRSYGMAIGYNSRQRARSGAFDFVGDRVVFPYTAEMKTVGRLMRGRLEALRREGAPAAGPEGSPAPRQDPAR
jgi:hypothetical protein